MSTNHDTERAEWKESITTPLRDWLRDNHAVCHWSSDVPNVGTISAYVVDPGKGLRMFFIMDYDNAGWDVFGNIADDLDVPGTLEAMEAHCGR